MATVGLWTITLSPFIVSGFLVQQKRFYDRINRDAYSPGRDPRGVEWLTWPMRRIKGRIRDRYLWIRQGRPRDEPVVVQPGQVLVCPHGLARIEGWYWSMRHQRVPIPADVLVDRYSARYPQRRVPYLSNCQVCCHERRQRLWPSGA